MLICKCSEIIPNENIEYSYNDGDDGEYYNLFAACYNCNAEYNKSEWGSLETIEERIEILQEVIDEKTIK